MGRLYLSEIWIYPIKSMGGIWLENAIIEAKGLRYDRRWMLIDAKDRVMTQREYPQMALFKPQLKEGKIAVTFTKAQKSSVEFSIVEPEGDTWITANVWGDEVMVCEVEPAVSEWFSRHLGCSCRLVAFPDESPRHVDPDYSVNNEQVSVADAYPFLIIGQSSLDDLNAKLTEPVPMNRFRPNFVFAGGEPFIEDQWRNLFIGNIPFVAVKKSDRCVMTTINQDTSQKGPEPLRTLSTYRKVANKVYFGQNLVALAEGEVGVGDPVIPG